MLEPVSAGIIAWVLLGESLTALQVLGSLVVLVGIVLAETARQPAGRRPGPHRHHTPAGGHGPLTGSP